MKKLFLGAANTIYFLVVDAGHPIDEIKSAIQFWTKFITCYAPNDKLSQEYSIVLIGNKMDKLELDSKKKSELRDLFEQFSTPPNQLVSRYCLISGF